MILLLAAALVLAFPRLGRACACCDGRTGVELLGWSADGQELLVRNEELRACERRVRLMVYRSGLPEPVRCFDLLGEPDRPVSCAETRASFDPAQTSQRVADFPRPLRSLSPQRLAATASLVVDGGFRKAAVRVLWLGDAGPKPVAAFETYEYCYYSPATEEENELVPLEVSVLWPEGDARQAALLAAGFDEAPGIGHSGWRLRWISLPPGLRTEPGVHWIRAVADYGSSPRPREESKQARSENTLGLRALEDGRLDRARRHLEHALAYDPQHVLARYNLACVLARQGLKYHALRELETVMTKPPPEVVETRRARALVDPDLASLREEPRFIAIVGHRVRPDAGSAEPSAKASAGTSARTRAPSVVPSASSVQPATASGPSPSSASTVSREARCSCRASPPPDPWSSLVFGGLVLALGTLRRVARGRRADGRRAMALALLLASGGCGVPSRSAPVTSVREASAPKPATLADACSEEELRAAGRESAQGRLWSAKRGLERCSGLPEAELALAEAEAALGDWRSAQERAVRLSAVEPERLQNLHARIAEQRARSTPAAGGRASRTAADRKLQEAEHLLQLDDPEQGGDWARSVYFSEAPQPEAALLAARAATLQGDTPSAHLWFARATFELREAYGELSWLTVRVDGYERCARFDEDGILTIARERDATTAQLLRASEAGEDWAYHLRSAERSPAPRSGQWWKQAGYRLERQDEELVATRSGTAEVAWRLPFDDRAGLVQLVPALGSQGLLELGRLHVDCVARWRRIDLESGQATPYRFVPKVCQPSLQFAAPQADWFVFETPSPDWQSDLLYVIGRNGRTKSWPATAWPGGHFLIQWSDQEVLVAESTNLWAVNVWTAERRLVTSIPPELGLVTVAVRNDDGVVYLMGGRGNGYLDQQDGQEGNASVVLLEPAELQELRIESWSSGAERVVGRSRAEPWRVQVWNLKRRRREFSVATVSDAVRASVDATGRHLALSHHASAVRIDLANGEWDYTRVPGQRRQHQPLFVERAVVLAPAMWWWANDGPIHQGEELETSIHDKWLAAGPWVTRASERNLWLARSPGLALSVDVEVVGYVALSPRGKYAVAYFLDEQRKLRTGILALTPAPPRAEVIWSHEAKRVRAVFARDGCHAYVATEQGWFDVALPEGRAERIDPPWPVVPLQLSKDGRRALLPTGVATGPDGLVVTMEGLPELGAGDPSPLVAFALEDEIVVGATKREILLWRSRDGALLGRLLPVGRAWAFNPNGMDATGTGPVELLGDVSELALLCAAEDRVYPWEVCADYFERPRLFARTLERAGE